MAKFQKKRSKTTPEISTASLPDIIFILLFFFMVATTMKEQDIKVRITLPKATELQKLERKSLVSFIYVGPPIVAYQKTFGTAPKIQLDDAFADPSGIIQFIENKRAKKIEAKEEHLIPYMTTSLRVDKAVKMGIISDIKQELRKAQALKINYSTLKREEIY